MNLVVDSADFKVSANISGLTLAFSGEIESTASALQPRTALEWSGANRETGAAFQHG